MISTVFYIVPLNQEMQLIVTQITPNFVESMDSTATINHDHL